MDTKRGWGGGVMNWAIGIDMYTLMCIKWATNKNQLFLQNKDFVSFLPLNYNLEAFLLFFVLQHSWARREECLLPYLREAPAARCGPAYMDVTPSTGKVDRQEQAKGLRNHFWTKYVIFCQYYS